MVFRLRPAPAILGAVIAYHLDKFEARYPHSVELLRESLYVDDFIAEVVSVKESIQLYHRTKQIMLEAGMNLYKWLSSFPFLFQQIQLAEGECDLMQTFTQKDDLGNSQIKTFESNDSRVQAFKLLGLQWDSRNDCFSVILLHCYNLLKTFHLVRGHCYVFLLRYFDPLGFLSPFVITMFQQLCADGRNWDAEITGKLLVKWKKTLSDMQSLNYIKVPRYYHGLSDKPVSIELHGFSDVSISAYAAMLYMHTCFENGEIDMRIIASKTKVIPIKQQTIPRLEHMAELLLPRLVSNTTRVLSFNGRVHCSTCVLYWIQSNNPWIQFVSHQVQEIHKLTDKCIWRHCPGIINPADLPSHGITALKVICGGMDRLFFSSQVISGLHMNHLVLIPLLAVR